MLDHTSSNGFGFSEKKQVIHYLQLAVIVLSIFTFIFYKLYDFTEPFAYGHARWGDAYLYWFGMMHCDLGPATTALMNVEGVTGNGELIYYRSVGPLEGIAHSFFLCLFDGQYWAVRILPLIATFFVLGILIRINHRFSGPNTAFILTILFLGSPFILKYGSSDTGFWALPISLGVAGWLFYLKNLESRRQSLIYASILCFSVGVLGNWQAGFMGLPVFLHIAFLRRPLKWRLKILALFSISMSLSIGAVLLHQGIVTGDFLYPFRRVIERSESTDISGSHITWIQLFSVQLKRCIDYFGPIAALLASYWFLRNLVLRTLWKQGNGWILSFVLTGIFYGFLFRNAAYIHDFLIVGFLPGFMLAASAGIKNIYGDISKTLPVTERKGAIASTSFVLLLLTAHITMAVHSATIFEDKEIQDLANGEASVALYLSENLNGNEILAADWSSGYHRTESADGNVYANLRPHLAYLTRKPVRFIDSLDALKALLQEVKLENKSVVLVQLEHSSSTDSILVPENWILEKYGFNSGKVLSLGLQSY